MKSAGNHIVKTFFYIVLGLYSIIVIFPLYLMVVTSLKSNKGIFTNPFGVPKELVLSNYNKVFGHANYFIFMRNSLIITVSAIVLILVLSSLSAYIFGKFKFKGRNFLYVYSLAGIMIPIKLGTLNIVQLMNGLGLFNKHLSLIIVYTVMGLPIGIFILTNFVRDIPDELRNAARIDGLNEYGIFSKIIVPLLSPALASVAIVNLIPIWNEFWFGLILIRTDVLKTIPVATAALYGQYETQFGMVFAVLTVSSLPLIILYLILSKQFIKGLTSGALKG